MRVDERKLANWLVSAGLVLALLVLGKTLLVPLVFALMLWAILNELTDQLRRIWFPGWLAWTTAFLLIGFALYFVAQVLANQAGALALQIPGYVNVLQNFWASHVPYPQFSPAHGLQTLLDRSSLPDLLAQTAASIGNTMLGLILVVAYLGFLLVEQRFLPEKLAEISAGRSTKSEGQQVFHAIGQQVRSYLGVCTLMSVAMGAISYGTLTLFGVSFAGSWALLMFLLTYIPTVGAVGVLLPALMALAQFQVAAPALAILLILGASHLILTNVVEPVMLGRSLNLSPFAIILSLTFWGLVWGVAGLFLAVPMTGAMAIACRRIDGLQWLAVLIAGPPPGQGWWPRKRGI
ncbi:AI-2E family transporter [Solirhodobacter olei]|uniref:AI-2E family transporter n=1 Tax=Solirhodobacter olei TaxID=2493082 RepID=UPI000FD8135B|nr:AI-2E family transporter [Solirhodobacter olei]